MGQEYSTIVQIIVKADREKAIARRSVSCKMTCYFIPDVKTRQILSLRFVPYLQSAVYILYPVCSLYFVSGLQSIFCIRSAVYIFCIRSAVCCPHFVLTGIRGTNSLFLVTFIRTTHIIYNKIPVCEVIRHFRSFPP